MQVSFVFMPWITLLFISCGIIFTLVVCGWFFLHQRPGLHTRHILVVDDAPVSQMVLCKVLNDLGYNTDSAADGREAVTMAARQRYDLVFMDCQMPNMDGFAATKAIRALPVKILNSIIIVALTGDTEASDRDHCLRAGMNDYMRKPFRADQINDMLHKWLG